MITTPTKAVTRPITPQLAMRSPRNMLPNSSTKNGDVLTRTAALPAPASVVPSAMPSNVSVTISRPDSAAPVSARPARAAARAWRTRTRTAPAPPGSARSVEKTTARGVLGADVGGVERRAPEEHGDGQQEVGQGVGPGRGRARHAAPFGDRKRTAAAGEQALEDDAHGDAPQHRVAHELGGGRQRRLQRRPRDAGRQRDGRDEAGLGAQRPHPPRPVVTIIDPSMKASSAAETLSGSRATAVTNGCTKREAP